VLLAYKLSYASELVTATAIEANEFPQLAQEMQVWAVPRIVVDGEPRWDGALPEPEFLRRVLAS